MRVKICHCGKSFCSFFKEGLVMADPTQAVEFGELFFSSFGRAAVLAMILEKVNHGAIGVRVQDIAYETGLPSNKAEELATTLEGLKLVTSWAQQVGTGGTCDRFYKPVPGVCVKVFGPVALNK